jgi:hypothetical protein
MAFENQLLDIRISHFYFEIDMGMSESQVAAEAQQLHNGDLVVQLDPQNGQVIIGSLENKKINPIIFDLKKGLIYNAAFPQAEVIEVGPAPP